MPVASDLPIQPLLPQLQTALAEQPRVLLHAPPGAGKTTSVPLALLDAPWLGQQRIILLEPRRLAARLAAKRMAALLKEPVGKTVGYRVHMENRVSRETRIEVVTEGILTRMIQHDPELNGVGIVIFDEFHERSLQADMGLAFCLDAQEVLRDDLRLLVMSATLDTEALQPLLDPVVCLSCEGRQYPVSVHYTPPKAQQPLLDAIALTVRQALLEHSGNLLVFLPGTAEIRQLEQRLHSLSSPTLQLCPLYGGLSQPIQDQAIQPPAKGCRKVVLATNIAETSLTIEGVSVVIDSGLVRVQNFSPSTAMSQLVTLQASQANAEQRSGRAGRLGPGVCYRMWSDQQRLAPHSAAEISYADLCPLALELALWGCHDPTQLCWLTPPPAAAYAQAISLLKQLGALDKAGKITEHGKAMAQLPMHPRLAHMVLVAKQQQQGLLACQIAALLSERDILSGTAQDKNCDLRLRLEALQSQRYGIAGMQVDRYACQRLRQLTQRWQKQLDIATPEEGVDNAYGGEILALAYPDRIAQQRGQSGQYRMRFGKGVQLAAHDPLAQAPFIVVASVDERERHSKVFLAASIDEAVLLQQYAGAIQLQQQISWNPERKAVEAMQSHCLDSLILKQSPLAQADPAQLQAVFIQGLQSLGCEQLPWDKASRQLWQRLQLAHRLAPKQWPDVRPATLDQQMADWLGPFLAGIQHYAKIQPQHLTQALQHQLSASQQQQLTHWLPSHLQVATGQRLAIDYSAEQPVLALTIQQAFGLASTPEIAGGQVSLLLHLLSPARRPVQITRDLASFWQDGYFEVKKTLQGRYPKHAWPADPKDYQPAKKA